MNFIRFFCVTMVNLLFVSSLLSIARILCDIVPIFITIAAIDVGFLRFYSQLRTTRIIEAANKYFINIYLLCNQTQAPSTYSYLPCVYLVRMRALLLHESDFQLNPNRLQPIYSARARMISGHKYLVTSLAAIM